MSEPTYVVAEIGINHNGSLENAKELIRLAQFAGADAVKFQKRTPRLCVPRAQWRQPKKTPWGTMDYIDYREKVEFSNEQYNEISMYCEDLAMPWFMSVWDEEALDFAQDFDLPFLKIGSASFTDGPLVKAVMATDKPVIVSTGMADEDDVRVLLGPYTERKDVTVCHCTSIYPCPPERINLNVIPWMTKVLGPFFRIGYSGHEIESGPTIAAVALGARYIERHITDSRQKWGSDQRASLSGSMFRWMVQQIRRVEAAMGDGVKTFYPEEQEAAAKLKRDPAQFQ